MKKTREGEDTKFPSTRYHLRVAFDFERPMGQAIGTVTWSDHELRKLTLLDVGVIRLSFDNFIREYAREQGAELEPTGT